MASTTAPVTHQRPATERAATARASDPLASQSAVAEAVEAFPTEAVVGALVRRPGPAHPLLVEAMAGRGVLYDALYYAVLDFDVTSLDAALARVADPDTWQVLASAIAGAPAASDVQLRRLLTVVRSGTHPDDVLVDDLVATLEERLGA